jgi:hypothetical protein
MPEKTKRKKSKKMIKCQEMKTILRNQKNYKKKLLEITKKGLKNDENSKIY